jgi:hypothetical protein
MDGQFNMLGWIAPYTNPKGDDKFFAPLKEADAINKAVLLKLESEIFSYGLDFSVSGSWGATFPPHLYGSHWGYVDEDGKQQGDWMVGFVPVHGLKERTYVLRLFGPMLDLANGKIRHRYFYIKIPTPGEGGPKGYLFRFSEFQKATKATAEDKLGPPTPQAAAVGPRQHIDACVANLKILDGATEVWANEYKKKTGDKVAMADLVPVYIKVEPRCPSGTGSYILGRVGTAPQCPNFDASNEHLKQHRLP